MNISSEISSIYQSNSSGYVFSNDTYFNVFSVTYIICILLSFPINSYVIWLIVRGAGNGLAAEFFILNLSVCKMLLCVESLIGCLFFKLESTLIVALFIDGLVVTSHPLFECLISVERYLAVVHPVTFLKYKPLRYRLMCSAVVWMTAFATGLFNASAVLNFPQVYFIFMVVLYLVLFSIQLFCCVAVLRALKQSGPGERGREREEENHMKRRAFYLIFITTVNMVILYFPYIIVLALLTQNINEILIILVQISFILAGLLQPVVFIYRVGKLNFIKCQ